MTATGTVRFSDAQVQRPGAAHFTQVATAVLRGRGLSPWAKLLYVVLRSYAGPAGDCYPGYTTLQADVGCGINQLTRAMRELETVGLVTRRRRGQGKPTFYTVHAPGSSLPNPSLFHARSESRPTARVKQESPSGGAKLDSGDLDPEEQHHQGSPAPLAPTTTNIHDSTSAGDDDALLAALISRGITPRVAQTLCQAHEAQAIRDQLTWHSYRPTARNPAGSLVQAIRERWPAPAAWLEDQEQAAAVARQAEAERQSREEEESRRREWEARPPEERIAGRLTFWIQSRRAKRHEPTAAEIDARRAELLAELLTAGGVS